MNEVELQNALIANQQAQAANTVALIEAIVDGRIGLVDVDLGELEIQVRAVKDLLDGDEASEGFQTFQNLVSRLGAVETTNTAQAEAITNLQNSLASQVTTINNRVDQVESDGNAARDALDGRVTTLEQGATAAAAARLAKDNEHDQKIGANETAINNTGAALQDEATARVAGDTANSEAIGVERGRVDALTTQAGTFVTRSELDATMEASGQAFINTLWAGRTRPSGLPNTDGSVSA